MGIAIDHRFRTGSRHGGSGVWVLPGVKTGNGNGQSGRRNPGGRFRSHRQAHCYCGSSAINQRPGFMKLVDRMEAEDVLVVTKLDRLGRNAIDVATTVKRLEADGVRVHCLALGGVDLTSSAGKMIMGVIAAMAEFERDLIIERTNSGLARARQNGRIDGRPPALTEKQRAYVRTKLAAGSSARALAKELGTSRMTIMRSRDEIAA